MKKSLIFVVLLSGCSTMTASSSNPELQKSLKSWQLLKQTKGDNYQYDVEYRSWVGFGHKTTISVKNENVIGRQFESWGKSLVVTEKWVENTQDVLGSHKSGAALKTIDDLYAQCNDDVLSKSTAENNITLIYDEQNILQTCTYRPKKCMDDCSSGVSIRNLKFKTR